MKSPMEQLSSRLYSRYSRINNYWRWNLGLVAFKDRTNFSWTCFFFISWTCLHFYWSYYRFSYTLDLFKNCLASYSLNYWCGICRLNISQVFANENLKSALWADQTSWLFRFVCLFWGTVFRSPIYTRLHHIPWHHTNP